MDIDVDQVLTKLQAFIQELDGIVKTADVKDDCRLASIRLEKCEDRLVEFLKTVGFAVDARIIYDTAHSLKATYGAPRINSIKENVREYKDRLTVLIGEVTSKHDSTRSLSVQSPKPEPTMDASTRKTAQAGKAPSCFISYSWDSDEHMEWVRRLATELKNNGVQTRLDQWNVRLGMDLPLYMETSIRESDFVLLICTSDFAKKANAGKGGVGYEKTIVTGEIYQGANPCKFVPVLRAGKPDEALPSYLKSKAYEDFREDSRFQKSIESVLRHIFGEPEHPEPELGEKPSFESGDEPPRLGNVKRQRQETSADDIFGKQIEAARARFREIDPYSGKSYDSHVEFIFRTCPVNPYRVKAAAGR